MKVLVTGGAGFIGSHTIKALLERGDEVVCIDNLNDYYNPKLKEHRLKQFESNKNFKFYKEDLANVEKLKKILDIENPEKIIHLAARAGVRESVKYPLLYEEANIKALVALLELSKNIKNFVFASTSAIYGDSKEIPFKESQTIGATQSFYAASKLAGENICHYYSEVFNIPITCLRFFTVYGPSTRPDMALFKFTHRIFHGKEIDAYGFGKLKRDFTYVTDVVAGILLALDKNLKFEIINLGNENPHEVNYLISLIEKNLNKKAIINYVPKPAGDVDITYADTSKAKNLLNYKPKVQIEEGVKNFVEWYVTEGSKFFPAESIQK